MKIVVTIAALNFAHGGPPRTVRDLCRALGRLGAEVEIITISEGRDLDYAPQEDAFTLTVIPSYADRYHPKGWRAAFRETVARTAGRKSTVIYDVGIWLPSNHFATGVAAATGTPLVISPRGMLSPRALQVAKWKKRIGWHCYQRRDLKLARVLHATSQAEAGDLRQSGLKQPIAVVPNGTDIPPELAIKSGLERRTRTLLFLSRLHPIKGLSDLVRAWAQVRRSNWRVVIAGPDENDHRREIESLIDSLGVRSDFEFVGDASDEAKWELYAGADLFVLPSHSESFGQVVAEALASGLPVITTQATPWSDIDRNRCGWWIPTGVDALSRALREATSLTDVELRSMGARGRELVTTKYSWSAAAEKMISLFEWLIDRRERPQWLT